MKNAGRNLLEGFGEGIKNAAQSVYNSVKSIIDRVKNLFTGVSGFNTHSPSKWAEEVFENVLKGGEKGLRDETSGLLRTIDSTVGIAQNELQGMSMFGTMGAGKSAPSSQIVVNVNLSGGTIASQSDAQAVGRTIGEAVARKIRYKGGVSFA